MPLFKAALQQLMDIEVAHCKRQVQSMVLEVRQLSLLRSQAGAAGTDTKRLRQQHDKKMFKVKEQLKVLYRWQCLDGLKVPEDVAYTQAQVKAMYTGVLPWAIDAAGLERARAVYHGRLYHSAKSNADRTAEEFVLLKSEKQQLSRWIDVCTERVLAAVAVQAQKHAESTSAGAGVCGDADARAPATSQGHVVEGPMHGHTHDSVADGSVYLLHRWQDRLSVMRLSVIGLLVGIPLPDVAGSLPV